MLSFSGGEPEMKKKIFDILQIGDKSNQISRSFDFLLVINILVNIGVMLLETFDEFMPYMGLLRALEIITTIFFCVEYVLRIWTATYLYPGKKESTARLRFLISFDGIVDLCTILPAFFLSGFVVLRMLRVVRIFHLFRLNAQYDSFQIIATVIKERRNQIFASLFIILILMSGGSLCLYSAEHEVQPEIYRNAFSGFWWAMSTVLTVGYGDIYPVTVIGQIMAIIIAFLGVGAVAIPTGIISAGFVEQYRRGELAAKEHRKVDLRDFAEIEIDDQWNGMSLSELRERERMEVHLLIRGELSVLPKDNVRVQTKDIVIVKIDQ